MVAGEWFVTQEEKTPNQKAVIDLLPAGAEAPFHFEGIAYFFRNSVLRSPESNPGGLEVYVESLETVQD